jgi:hypothetical protein
MTTLAGPSAGAHFALFRRRHVNVHGLDSDSPRAGEPVPHDLAGAGEQAG